MRPWRLRLVLAAGAAEVRLRARFPRLTWALTCQPAPNPALFTELRRLETDPAYRAVFRARLDAAIAERDAVREAEAHAAEAAAAELLRVTGPRRRGPVRP